MSFSQLLSRCIVFWRKIFCPGFSSLNDRFLIAERDFRDQLNFLGLAQAQSRRELVVMQETLQNACDSLDELQQHLKHLIPQCQLAESQNQDVILNLQSLQKQLSDTKQELEAKSAEVLAEATQGNLQTRSHCMSALLGQKRGLAQIQNRSEPVSESHNSSAWSLDVYQETLNELEHEFPHAYRHWYPRLEDNRIEYEANQDTHCSTNDHEIAKRFRDFLSPVLQGRVLDIGCGPQEFPSYLAGHPNHLISGIDPILPKEPHPFEFVHGFGEKLPWQDNTFDLVVAATTLDHVLSLDKTFEEAIRVLKPNGIFAVWVGFLPGYDTPYDPTDPNLVPADKFHLFHFSRGWFEESLQQRFQVLDHLNYDEWSHFYSFAVKPSVSFAVAG